MEGILHEIKRYGLAIAPWNERWVACTYMPPFDTGYGRFDPFTVDEHFIGDTLEDAVALAVTSLNGRGCDAA